MYIKFLDSESAIKCTVKQISPHVVELGFEDKIVVNQSGFRAYLDAECEYDIAGTTYEGYTTMYRNDETTVVRKGYQLSNDGSVWEKPFSKVTFTASVGGSLNGVTTQEVYKYEELNIPEPIADADYEFSNWSPEVPSSGDVEGNKTFTAIFVSTLPEPEPEPTVEERLTVVEEKNAMLSMTVDSILTDVIPSLM